MLDVTGRLFVAFGTVAILLGAGCESRSGLHGSTDAAGGSATSTGGSGGPGGYWGGDGIAPLGTGGDAWPGGGGYPGGGSVGAGGLGAGGVDPNCFMRCGQGNAIYYSSGGAGGAGGAPSTAPPATDSGASDCAAKLKVYYAAVNAAEQCDPSTALPCAAYDGVECPSVGVNPDAVAALSAGLADYRAAGCSLPLHSCPIIVMTPPPYTCQAGSDGVFRCYSICENMSGGRATCVSQSAGCTSTVLPSGFCSGTGMVCCAG